MLYSSLELALEMETSKFTIETMTFQCFSNILNPRGELIEQVPGDCPTPTENLWVDFIQNTHPEHGFIWRVVGFMHMRGMCMYVLCVYRCIYINSRLPVSSTELISA